MKNCIRSCKVLCALFCVLLMICMPVSPVLNVKADYRTGNVNGAGEETCEERTGEDGEEVSDEECKETPDEDGKETPEDMFGYIDMPDQEETENIAAPAGGDLLRANNIPVSYDSRDYGRITSVKNQNPYGTCWSFSTMAALESSLITFQTAENPDLSEMHLIRYAYPDISIGDPLGGTDSDTARYVGTDKMNEGNNVTVAYHALANWKGVTNESHNPYPENPGSVTLEDAYNYDIFHLQQYYRINASDGEYVKQAIMEYGAVSGSMGYFATFYNPETAAYYADFDKGSNHAVTFIGWDDNYSKENFNEPAEYYDKSGGSYRNLTRPKNDGAWLVKNSWGSSWGNDGYFWMSYEDFTLGTFSVLVGEPEDNYDHNYQYDGTFLNINATNGMNEITAANVFTIKGKEQYLEAVSFDTPSSYADYTVEIYTNLTDLSNPTSGKKISEATVQGRTVFTGYYTVKLPEKVTVIPGNTVAVVVTLKRNSSVGIYAEKTETRYNSSGRAYAEYVASAKPNESFLKTSDGWMDYGRTYNRNLRIKAFTSDIPESELVNPFADIREDGAKWKYDSALYVFNNGYMTGKGMTKEGMVEFSPDTLINRSQFVQVLYSLEGKPEVEYEPKFDDVPYGKWFTNPVTWAVNNDIVAGKGKVFDVNGAANREQMALIFFRYAQFKGYDVSADPEGKSPDDYSDADEISPWATDAVKWAVSRGIITGKGNETAGYRIDPRGKTTRIECAAILKKFLDIYMN